MNIEQSLAFGRSQLVDSDSPQLDSRLLLEHTTGMSHSQLISHADSQLTFSQETNYRNLLIRAADHEPIPYLVGSAPFYNSNYIVNSSVLIPRPETELLVEAVVDWAAKSHNPAKPLQIVDVGTGSGCIAITLARLLPLSAVTATDISNAALLVAIDNARKHRLEGRINFLQGDLLQPVSLIPDVIVANLPYVADDEWNALDESIQQFEPNIALRAGRRGMDQITSLLHQAKGFLSGAGAIFLEIGWKQAELVKEVAAPLFPRATIEIQADLSAMDRIVIIKNPSD